MSSRLIGQTLLNQFRVDCFIASGGMGTVYQVLDLKRNVPLAMKVLHTDLADDPSILKRFQREANALKKLAHPNIVPFYGLYKTADFAFLLERFINGPSLKEVLRKTHGKTMPVNEVLTYMKALSAALGYAHANGVVHCDVKPGNVMIDQGGNVYLTDFGIARHAESDTTTLAAVGTAVYMAPEQIRGEAVTPTTDIYALGVMLFEMLVGHPPFQGTENNQSRSGTTPGERIQFAHLHLTAPDPSVIIPSIPSIIGKVVIRCLEKIPNRRYQSTQEFFLALCNAVGSNPAQVSDYIDLPTSWFSGSANAISTSSESWPVYPGHKGGFFISIIQGQPSLKKIFPVFFITITFLTVIIYFVIQNSHNGTASVSLVTPLAGNSLSPPTSGSAVINSILPSESFTQALQQTGFTATTQTAQAELTRLAVNVAPLPPNTYSAHFRTATDTPLPSANKNSIRLVFVKGPVGNSDIYTSDANGGQIMAVANRPCDEAEPALSTDGVYIVYQSNCDGSYDIWRTEYGLGTNPVNLTQDYSHDEREPYWSSDNRQIAYRVSPTGEQRNDNGEIWIMNADGSGRNFLGIMGRSPTLSPDGQYLAYMSNESGKWQIYVFNLTSRRVIPVTSGTYHARWPSWSPDGKFIVFNSSDNGSDATGIWYTTVSSNIPVQVIYGAGYGRPTWSSNGWIAFNSDQGIDIVKPDGSAHKILIKVSDVWCPAYSH